jgi:hypothetical protein
MSVKLTTANLSGGRVVDVRHDAVGEDIHGRVIWACGTIESFDCFLHAMLGVRLFSYTQTQGEKV